MNKACKVLACSMFISLTGCTTGQILSINSAPSTDQPKYEITGYNNFGEMDEAQAIPYIQKAIPSVCPQGANIEDIQSEIGSNPVGRKQLLWKALVKCN